MEIKYEPFRHVWYVEKNGIICYVTEWAVEYIKGVESENAKLREELEFEKSENGWAREFLNRMAVHCGTKDCPSLVSYVDKLRELCNDMWLVMSCECASDAMADACRYALDCEMDEVERRVNELCEECDEGV